ncbi:MAG: hypothetical protein A4S09_06845 [Proteobacteria bacterium SG_bin7]|nr:MAG: hypothetical protein A4S09_06845 [Proteobacteria bacterium SG_bin7]
MTNFNLSSFVVSLGLGFASTSAFAVCTEVEKKAFDVVASEVGSACVGILHPSNPVASDGINGDIIWKQSGKSLRVGSAVDKFVVVNNGMLMVVYEGNKVSVQFWDLATQKTKKCSQDVSAREVTQGTISFDVGVDFINVRSKLSSKSFFSNCQDSGDTTVYTALTAADRAVLDQFRDGDRPNDLTNAEVAAGLNEILGRDEMVDTMIATVSNREGRSTLLWGPAGVGKTTLAERLAQRIVRKQVPVWLQDWSVYLISLGKMGEEGVKGRSEKKMSDLVAAASGKKVILVMDEIHQLVGLGTGKDDSTDVTEIMKTNLANGQLAVIGTLTDNKDEMPLLRTKEAFFSRFSKIYVGEPDDKVLLEIYKSRAKKETKKYGMEFSEEVLKKLLQLTRQYVPTENNPRIGIRMIETVASLYGTKNSARGYQVTIQDFRNAVGTYANIPALTNSAASNKEGRTFKEIVKNFRADLSKDYIGQDSAKDAVYRTLVRVAAGNQKADRPSGIFLFLGPSGVGKTFMAEKFASMLNLKYQVWAMSQYQNESNIANFLGAPPTYVGYNPAGGELTRFINNNPSAVLNFDEADKSEPRILDMLINLMETGKIRDNSNVEASLRNGYLFFTSNFGMPLIDAYDREVLKIPDESQGKYSKKYDGYIPRDEEELKKELLNQLLGTAFGTYFAGRIGISNIVIFHHHNSEEARKIAELEIKKVVKALNAQYVVEVDKSVVDYIATHGVSFQFGARKVRDLAESMISFPVSEKVMSLEDGSFSKLRVSLKAGKNVDVEAIK